MDDDVRAGPLSEATPMRRHQVAVADLQLHHLSWNPEIELDAPPVVLVHGLGLSSTYMSPVGEELAKAGFRVLAPDLPGFGRSGKPDHVLKLDELADALADWMTAVGLQRAVLLGNSQGCQVAVETAVRHPERIAGLVLQGPTTDPRARSPLRQFIRWRLNVRREPKGMGPVARRAYRRAGLWRLAATSWMMLRDPIEAKLPRVEAPALVVRGTRDPIVPQRWAEEVVRRVGHGSLALVPDVAHTMVFHHPAELARAAAPFLLSLGGGGRTGSAAPDPLA